MYNNYKDNNYKVPQIKEYGKERYSKEFINQFMNNIIK